MSDIRKRQGPKGTTYQVRYAKPDTKSGYGYASFDTLREARSFLQNLGTMKHAPGGRRTTVEQAVDQWLDICEKIGRNGRETVEKATMIEYRRRAEIIKSYPWNKHLHELVAADVVRFRTWLLQNKSRDLARRALSSFHSVIIEMRQAGYVQDDPAAGISIRSDGRHEGERAVEIPTTDEIREILAATDDLVAQSKQHAASWARYKPMIHLAVFTGMRPSEYRGISWDSLEDDRVHVRQRADRFGDIGPVKSRAGRRTIFIPRAIATMIFEWREQCPKSPHNLIFPTATGKPIPLNNFTRRAWEPLLIAAGVTARVEKDGEIVTRAKYTPYALRHYFASKLIASGKDLKFIQSAMGHADIQMTLNVYGHLLSDREAEHCEMAEGLASELMPG